MTHVGSILTPLPEPSTDYVPPPSQGRRRPDDGRPRFRPKEFKPTDVAVLGLSVASAFCMVWIVFTQLTSLNGTFGFLVCWILAFFVVYWVANSQLYGRRVGNDRLMASVVTLGAICLFTPLLLLIFYLLRKGLQGLTFYIFVHSNKGYIEACSKGFKCVNHGLAHAMVGTLEQVALAAIMGVPAAIMTAIFLNEVRGRFTQGVRVVVTAMSGLPAIVAGVFIYAMWIQSFGLGFSGFAGALALAVLLLPTVTRGTEEVLRIVPNDLREASAALASPEWRTVWSVVLPTARSGMITATLLGIAVAIGETAPLILTIFGANVMNWNAFSGKQSALPLMAFQQVRLSLQKDINFGYTAALVLFILVFTIFILARILGSQWLGNKVRERANRRSSAQSRRMAAKAAAPGAEVRA
jgi:phosphate transport system permease protein